jgi:SAM-dependent methyltransferase
MSQEVIRRWSETAPYWEKHRAIIREMFAPVSQALIEAAQLRRRMNVLDVATGPGEPALTIAERLGAQCKVVGIDAVPEMVEAARREAQRRQLRNASFAVAHADTLPAQTNGFDAVVSRFGIMFFPSPGGAVREMLRVLRPGARMALAVWHFADRNPFHHVLSRLVDRYVESPPLPPDAPDAFRYAEPGKLAAVVAEAGAAEVSEKLVEFSVRAPVSPEEFWNLRSEMSEGLRSRVAKIPPEQMKELKREVLAALRQYYVNGAVTVPAQVLIVTASKGG